MSSPSPATAPATISLRSLGLSLGLLIIVILLAAGAIGWTYLQTQQVQRQYQSTLSRQNETKARLARVNDDERDIREKIARYHEIIQRGLTQPEQRLQWVEMLKAIKESRRLFGLSYEIAPQHPLDPKQITSGSYDFLVSTMKMDLLMLHEEDLLGLLADISSQSQALINAKSCQIERLKAGTPTGANLKASCEIDWIKLQEKR